MKARFQQLKPTLPFAVACLILATCLLPAGRIPTGDAPHLLGISGRLAEELTHGDWGAFSHHLGSLVAPHPPGGYLLPTAAYALGFGRLAPFASGIVALFFIWKGMCLLAFKQKPLQSWPALLILLACPLFWLALSELYWDLFAAACLSMCLGHAAASEGLRDRHHSLRFGMWMGAGFLCKYTFPAFAFFPAILLGFSAWKAKTLKHLGMAIGGFLLLAGPWLFLHWGQVLPYVFDSLNSGSQMVDRASISGATDPLYYGIVLKDALGWPGLAVLFFGLSAWRHPGARLAIAGGLGGIGILSSMGQQEPRYLLPALPLFAAATAYALQNLKTPTRWAGGLVFLGISVPMLSYSSGANRLGAQVPAERKHEHHRASLQRWGDWPGVHPSFMPVSAHPDTFSIDIALSSMAAHMTKEDNNTVGLLLDGTAGELKDGLFFYRSARMGLFWDFVSLAPPPGGHGKVFAKFKGPFHAKNEAPTRFQLLYAATSPKDKTRQRWLQMHGATELARIDLPNGLQGQVLRLNTWVQTDRELLP
jgi:hypothetical protein